MKTSYSETYSQAQPMWPYLMKLSEVCLETIQMEVLEQMI